MFLIYILKESAFTANETSSLANQGFYSLFSLLMCKF